MGSLRLYLGLTLLIGALTVPTAAASAPLEQKITIGLGEEYNSNVNETPTARADWVTVVSAVGGATYEASRVTASAQVNGTYNFYALGNRTDEFKGTAQVKATGEIIKELLFIEGEDLIQQVYTNLARGETNPTDSTRNQVNQNTTTGRIYITPKLNDRLQLKLGYQFIGYFYDKPELNKQANSVFLKTNYEITPNLQFLVEGDGVHHVAQTSWFDRVTFGGGFRWEYSSDGFIVAKAGPRFTRYNYGEFILDPYWDAKLTHTAGKLQAILETSSVHTENPSSKYTSRKTGAGVTVAWKDERASIQARAAYSYLDGPDTQDSEQIALSVTTTYELTPRLTLKASVTRDASLASQKNQTRWYADGSATYDLGKDFSLEGYCKWKLSESTQGGKDDYFVNIVGIRLKKTF